MCGIAGILAFEGGRPAHRDELARMIGTVHHRGPDGTGFHQDGPIGLAHARLSIIDLATGDQPLTNEDRTLWTVFNGEIFNYVELRATLERAGHVFRTHSDTETIVHAYEEYGDDFVRHLNGQFAIALWDSRRRRLLLIRDRVGVRPLFVQRDGNRVLFASEIKAILSVSEQPRRIDLTGLAQVFTGWAPVEERTVFEGIRSLAPGCILSFEDGREHMHRYWDWEYPPSGQESHQSFDQAAEELRALLDDAIKLQLRADVPVGAYLSGGLDSSIIAALIRQRSDVPLRTFSVVFEDAEFDESEYQRRMVRHLGTDHTSVRCTREDIGGAFATLVEHVEVPIVRTGPVPLMILSRHVRESGFKVVLTGEGADEVFGGYDIFKEAQIRRFWARRPESKWRPALLTRLYPYLKHSPVGSGAFAQSFFGQGLADANSPFFGHAARWATTRRVQMFLSDDVRADLSTRDPMRELEDALPHGFASWRSLSRDQYVEAKTLLYGYLLSSQGDRVAMASSVEGRVPFLDHRVIEFVNRLPARYRLQGLREKAILRAAARDVLPTEILNRVKQPYRSPDVQSFFSEGKSAAVIEEHLTRERLAQAGYFNPQLVQRLVDKCRAGKAIGFADNMALVGILSTMILHQLFVRQNGAGATRNAKSA